MKLLRFLFGILTALTLFTIFPFTVLAQGTPTSAPAGKLDMTATYPKLETQSGSSVIFEVNLQFTDTGSNAAPRLFDLSVTAPKDWSTFITPDYPADKHIASLQLDPANAAGQKVEVNVAQPTSSSPGPGNYTVTLQASSGDIRQSINLTVVVTAKYGLTLGPSGTLYNTSAAAGKNNYFSVIVTNDGSAPVTAINLSADKPTDWAVEFSTPKIDSLNAGVTQIIDVNFKPPSNAIAGDYQVTVKAAGKEASTADMQVRVTVQTPTLWGWIGVGLIVIVIASVAFVFMRFSRR